MNGHTITGLIAVVTAVPLLMVALRRVQTSFALHPEVSRKLMHMAAGVLALTFPWSLGDPRAVWTASALCVGFLLFIKSRRGHRLGLHRVTGSVRRVGYGEILFPVAVGLLYQLANGNPVAYAIPLLVLTFADAIAALIGVSWGETTYRTPEGRKSAEGSLAFFIMAFFTTHVILIVGTDVTRLESILISTLLSLLLMVLEAVSTKGFDNLFLPVIGFALLQWFLPMDPVVLAHHLVCTGLALVAAILWVRRSPLASPPIAGA